MIIPEISLIAGGLLVDSFYSSGVDPDVVSIVH